MVDGSVTVQLAFLPLNACTAQRASLSSKPRHAAWIAARSARAAGPVLGGDAASRAADQGHKGS